MISFKEYCKSIDESGWISGVQKWKEAVNAKHGHTLPTFKKVAQPGSPGKSTTYATSSQTGNIIGVYQHHNKSGTVHESVELDEIDEAIKGWKHAHTDIIKSRAAASAAAKPIQLRRLTSKGVESKMSSTEQSAFSSHEDAQKHVDNMHQMNPGKKFSYNKYVEGKHVGVITKSTNESEELGESTWRTEQSDVTGRHYVVKGYSPKDRKVWKNKLGAIDFIKKTDAEAKAAELNKSC